MKLGTGLALTNLTTRGMGGSAPFVPTDIAGLQLWLDASDTATITEVAGSVSRWDDKSGNSRDMSQATGANQPTYVSGQSVQYVGAKRLFRTENLGLQTLTIACCITKIGNVNFNNTVIEQGNDGNAFTFRLCGNNNGDPNAVITTSSGRGEVFFSVHDRPNNQKEIYIIQISAESGNTRIIAHLNGVEVTNSTKTGLLVTNQTSLKVGTRDAGTSNFEEHELELYSSVLTLDEKNQLGTYLANKWGATWTV